jgi:glycine/D-amino acid oxidase-like deaminating enzyme
MKRFASGDVYDVLVIGGGILGLASAYYATLRGLNTLLVDQYGIGNAVNSSKGRERIFRVMHDNESEARLAEVALTLWAELERATSVPILAASDLLFFGHRDTPLTTEGNIAEAKKTMDQMGIPYEYLPSREAIHRCFPIFRQAGMAEDYVGLVQSNSAAIDVSAATRAFLQAADRSGLLHVLNSQVRVSRGENARFAVGSTYTVHAHFDSKPVVVRARHLVLCPGIWADSVLNSFGLRQTSTWKIWQMTFAYWRLKRPEPAMPLWYEFGNVEPDDHGTFYGFPPLNFHPSLNGTVKLSSDYTYDKFDDPSAVGSVPSSRLLVELARHFSQLFHLDSLDTTSYTNPGTCVYSMSPDGKLVLGRIPKEPRARSFFPRTALCIMESGRAFKYAPLFGRILVQLAVDGRSPYESDLAIFSPSRDGIFDTAPGC